MDNELDDDIVAVQAPALEESESDDDIVGVEAAPSFLDKKIDKLKTAFTPSEQTNELTNDLVDTVEDFAIGSAGGLFMNSVDELGGAVGAGLETLFSKIPGTGAYNSVQFDKQFKAEGGQVPEQSFSDIYKDYQSGVEKKMDESSNRSPIVNTLGQIGGSITGGAAFGGLLGLGSTGTKVKSIKDIAKSDGLSKAALTLLGRGTKSYLKSVPAIALESALTSKEHLIGDDANPAGVAADAAGGVLFGLPTMLGMQAVQDIAAPTVTNWAKNRLSKKVSETPYLRQLKKAYEYGSDHDVLPTNENLNLYGGPSSLEGGAPLINIDRNRAESIVSDILKKDKELAVNVGKSLDGSNVELDVTDLINNAYSDITSLSNDMPTLIKDPNFNKMMQKVLSRNWTTATPRDIKIAMNEIETQIERASANTASQELAQAPKILSQLKKQLNNRLKQTVPEYEEAAKRYSQFRDTYIEQPIAGRKDPTKAGVYYSNLKNPEDKLINAYENLTMGATRDDLGGGEAQRTFAEMVKKTKSFQDAENALKLKGSITSPITKDPNILLNKIKDHSDDAAVRRAVKQTQDSQAGVGLSLKNSFGVGNTGKGMTFTVAGLAGKSTNTKLYNKAADLARLVYNAPTESLSTLATKLESTPYKNMGMSLRKAVADGDTSKRNAALFTILQNPGAKLYISAEDFPDEEME